jgi:menaquinone-dependent protoporphyrinogen IX oxidase
MIADALAANGVDVLAAPVERVSSLDGFSGVVIGGALYANLWPWKVRRFVSRHLAALRRVPVWLFSPAPSSKAMERAWRPLPQSVRRYLWRPSRLARHRRLGGWNRTPAETDR